MGSEDAPMIVTNMNRADCMALLRTSRLARLACVKDGRPYVVPITYAADGDDLYSFSLLGQKIEWMRANPQVCVQVDGFEDEREWRSVVVHGRYEELPDLVGWKVQRERAWSLLSREAHWWEPGAFKPVPEPPTRRIFYRIVIGEVSGRHAFPERAEGAAC
jgi:nitroimidazol reductase NimA-like FMN-containing flavoprotein (pyridoxamine 5'-phosphate oxidase superfamily)